MHRRTISLRRSGVWISRACYRRSTTNWLDVTAGKGSDGPVRPESWIPKQGEAWEDPVGCCPRFVCAPRETGCRLTILPGPSRAGAPVGVRRRRRSLEVVVVDPCPEVVWRCHYRCAAIRPVGVPRARHNAVAFIEGGAAGVPAPTTASKAGGATAGLGIALGADLDPEPAKVVNPAESALSGRLLLTCSHEGQRQQRRQG